MVSLCPYDPSRLALTIGVSGVNNVQVAPRKSLSAGTGITLSQTGTSYLDRTFSDHGPLVGAEWWGTAAAAAVVEVIEVFRDEDPERRLGPAPEV